MRELKLCLIGLSVFLGITVWLLLYSYSQKYSASIFYDVFSVSPEEYTVLENEAMNLARGESLTNADIEVNQYIKDDSLVIVLRRYVGKDIYGLEAFFPVSVNTMELSEGTVKNDLVINCDKVKYYHSDDTYSQKSFILSCVLAFCLEVILQILVYKLFSRPGIKVALAMERIMWK